MATDNIWKERIELVSKLGVCMGALQGLRSQVDEACRARIDKLLEDIGDPSVLWRDGEHAGGASSENSPAAATLSEPKPRERDAGNEAPVASKAGDAWPQNALFAIRALRIAALTAVERQKGGKSSDVGLIVLEEALRLTEQFRNASLRCATDVVIEIDEHGKVHDPLGQVPPGIPIRDNAGKGNLTNEP